MKKNSIILFSIITLSFLGCSKDDTKVDNVALAAEKLGGTYSPTYVSLDGDDVSSDFNDFTISIDESLNFTSNSAFLDRQPNPWAASGSFIIMEPVDDHNSVTLLRNDGVELFAELAEASAIVELSFLFDADSEGSNGRTAAVEGEWLFDFEK